MKYLVIFKHIWPTLGKRTIQEIDADLEELRRNINGIELTDWSNAAEPALSEARRLYEEEEERRRVADTKATNLLTVAVALMSVLTFFEGIVWGEKIGSAPRWLTFSLLTLALMYVAGFGYWVLLTLKLHPYYRVGTEDLVKMAVRHKPHLGPYIVSYLKCTRRNQHINNSRLSCLNMAHKFFFRIFAIFAMVVIVESGFGLYDAIFKSPNLPQSPTLFNPSFLQKT